MSTRDNIIAALGQSAHEQEEASEPEVMKTIIAAQGTVIHALNIAPDVTLTIEGEITPDHFVQLFELAGTQRIPVCNLITIPSALWTQIALDKRFASLIDPVTRLSVMRTGLVGVILGASIVTDAVADPGRKWLPINQIGAYGMRVKQEEQAQ